MAKYLEALEGVIKAGGIHEETLISMARYDLPEVLGKLKKAIALMERAKMFVGGSDMAEVIQQDMERF